MSVGLGNVWRFPFTALENGGGAFLIPYLIVLGMYIWLVVWLEVIQFMLEFLLVLVGRPIYYMEMVIGQFSSRGPIKVYDLSPAMRGKHLKFHIEENLSELKSVWNPRKL